MLDYLSLGWLLVEAKVAFVANYLASSYALLAFGSDSLVEIASALAVLRLLRLDSGVSRTQGERTALFTSVLLIAIVPVIGIGSNYSFFFLKIQPETSVPGLAVALVTVAIMPILWIKKRQMGRKTACLALSIDAMESATCFLMSLALLVGLVLEFIFHFRWFDYITTIVILGFIAIEARESFMEAGL